MSVRTTIDLPDSVYTQLKLQAAEHRTSIRQIIVAALEREFAAKPRIRKVVPPLLKGRSKPGPQCPTTENPYDLLFT